ncbi:MAG: CinA family protein [Candidatus Coatesbacteria bacterium]|nr:CinA family protein [Candidatus Coatesbacteria bacterium]
MSRPYAQLQRESQRLAEEVARLFIAKGLTLAVAESFTGGLIAHTLTNVPGSSKFFLAGLCVYSAEAKVSVLGVPQDLIDKHDVVSAATAEEMARRVRLLCSSNVGLATTGYAGPVTGEERLPVGTVFIAASTKETTVSHQFHYDADRLGVKLAAAIDALRLLLHGTP